MILFQYAVIYIPKKKKDAEEVPAKVLVPVTDVLVENESQAQIIAARAIPEEYLTKLDQVQVVCRPF